MSLFIIIPATSYSSTLVTRVVPSAQQSLTSEFGMGSGVTSTLSLPEKLEWIVYRYRLFIRLKILKRSQVSRLLSTTRLNTLLHLHLWPIKPVFYWKSSVHKKGKSNLRMGFALICFQRLSLPNVATLRCH